MRERQGTDVDAPVTAGVGETVMSFSTLRSVRSSINMSMDMLADERLDTLVVLVAWHLDSNIFLSAAP